jgi:hypothetical protein
MYHHYAKTMEKRNDSDQNLEITEQFIREYCTRTELETKARDAALLLLKQLEECRKPPCDCKEQEEPKEEKKPEEEVKEETKEEAPKEEVPQEEKEEPVISEEKFQKLQNTRQGKKSYREYLRNQLKVIGLAGIIAMSTAVYAQSQVIYKNGIIIYAVLEKEFPILTTIKKLVISDETPSQSQSNTSGSSDSVASVSFSSSTSGSTFSNTNAESETNTASVEGNNTEVGPPLTPAEQEQIKKGEELLEDEKKEVTNLDPKPNQFGTPIVPPTTTNTNPQSE